MKRIILLWLFLICSISYGGTGSPDTPDDKYVDYGKKFTSVVRICGSYKNNPQEQYCGSAVIISPHYIVTAAHVVRGSRSCHIVLNNKNYEITQVVAHQDFEKDTLDSADIAVGYSKEPMNLDSYPELYTEQDEKNKSCALSGFGFAGNFNSGATFSDGERRAGTNVIDYVNKGLLFCSPSKPQEKNTTRLEFLIASGDSGGGLFIGNKLAGIHSFIFADKKPKSDYLTESAHTRISKYADWIKENMK
jgi:secreted trypsin-like serine protease